MPYTFYDRLDIADIYRYLEEIHEDIDQLKYNMKAIDERLKYLCKDKKDWDYNFKHDNDC